MKHLLLLASLAACLLQSHAALFYDMDAAVPAGASGWSAVNSGVTARGKVLSANVAGSAVSVSDDIPEGGVATFLARATGSADAKLDVRIDSEAADTVSLSPSRWFRVVVPVAGDGSPRTVEIALVSGAVQIDNLYVGRQLQNPDANGDPDVWTFGNDADGLILSVGSMGAYEGAWLPVGNVTWREDSSDGFVGDIRYTGNNVESRLRSVAPIAEPLSDYIMVVYEAQYQNPIGGSLINYIRPVLSTDEWASEVPVGEERSLMQRTGTETWLTLTNICDTAELQGRTDVMLGFCVRSANRTGYYVSIRSISVMYKSRAYVEDAGFYLDGVITNAVPVGADPKVALRVKKTRDAENVAVVLSHTRTNLVNELDYTLRKVSADEGMELWVSDETVSEAWGHSLEAGEKCWFQAYVDHFTSSLGLDKLDDGPFEGETFVTGIGSVWINEFSGGAVELAGREGRTFANWSVRAVEDATGDPLSSLSQISGTLGDAVRGVGFLVVPNFPMSALAGRTIRLQLLNSSGVVENETGAFAFSVGDAWAAMGVLPDKSDGDWTEAGSAFTWEAESAADATLFPGVGESHLNNGQSVELPVRLLVRFGSTDVGGAQVSFTPGFSDNSYSNMFIRIGMNPETTTTVVVDEETGEETTIQTAIYWSDVVDIPTDDRHPATHDSDFLSTLPESGMDISLSAFGWSGEPVFEGDTLAFSTEGSVITNTISFDLFPSIGEESFQNDYRYGNWSLMSYPSSSIWLWSSASQYAQADVRYGQRNIKWGRISTSVPVEPGAGSSRKYAKVGVTVQRNNQYSSLRDYLLPTLVDTNGTTAATFNSIGNVFATSSERNGWYRTVQRVELQPDVNGPYVFGMEAYSGNRSGCYLNFDDLYLSFQDWAAVTNCTPTKAMPIAGQAYLADWVLSVGEGGATGLTVELWAERVRAGAITTNSATVFQTDTIAAGTYVNPVLADGAVSNGDSIDLYSAAGFDGELFEGDQFSYWFKVVFDTNNGALQKEFQTDTTYFPDNAAVDAATGIWSVTGEYAPAPVSVTAWGPQEAWVNELHFDGANSWIEFAGRVYGTGVAEGPTSADIAGWRAVVLDASGNALSTTTLSSTSPLDGLRHDDVADNVGFYVLSGFELPPVGGLKVVDAGDEDNPDGKLRYAMCWGGSVPGCDVIYDGEPSSGRSLAAIGAGTPANATFWQEWVVQTGTEGAVNVGQSLANAAPKDASIAITACRADGFDIAVLASDIDKPVSYAIAGENAPSGWSTNTAHTVTGLAQNTEYTYTLSASDALAATTNNAATTSAWTLLDSWDLAWEALSATEVKFTATIDNLGEGDTAWGLEGGSMVELGSTNLIGGSGPNTSLGTLAFVAQNGAEVLSEDVKTVATAYTKAAAPGKAPVPTADPNQGVFITFAFGDDADQADSTGPFPTTRNGNPMDTEYALRAWLYRKDGTSETVDWIPTNSLADAGAPAGQGTWQTLAAWKTAFGTAHWDYDITPTNIVFAFVARNHGDHWVETVSEDTSSAHFELAVTTGDKTQDTDGSGGVTLSDVQIVNPFCNEITSLKLQCSTNGVVWADATLLSVGDGTTNFVSGATASGIPVESGATNLVARWGALADLGHDDFPNVALRWIAETENASLAGNPADAGTIDLNFALPSVTNVVFAGDLQNGKAKYANTLPFTVMFDDAVSGLSAGAFTVVGGTATAVAAVDPDAAGRSDRWTVSVTPSNLEAASLDIAITAIAEGSAIDNFGNLSQAWTGNASVAYDGKKPAVESITSTTPQNFNASKAPMQVSITFSEPVTNFNASGLAIVNGSVTADSFSESQDHRSFALTITPAADGVVSISVSTNACTDLAGNANTASTTLSRTYDTQKPVPTLSSAADGKRQKTDTFTVSVTFPENVTGLAKEDFTVTGGSAKITGSGKNYTLTVECDSNSAQEGAITTVTLPKDKCQDAAGNLNTAASKTISVTYDKKPPAVQSITSTTPQNFNASDAPMQVSIAFNEPVTNFTANALIHSITNGIVTPGSFTEAQDQKSFDLTITPTGDGVVSIFVPANACTDLAWNSNTVSTAISRTYDGTAPTVQTIAVDHTGYVSNAVLTATVTFSEAMNGVTADTLSVSQNAMAALVGSTDGTNYTFSVALNQDGPVTISVPGIAVPTDLAGNSLSGSKSFEETIVYDKTSPVVVLSSQPSNPTSVGDFAIKVSATEDNTAAGLALEWKLRDGNNDIVRSGSASAAPTNLWVAAGSGLPAGTYDFMAIVTDAAGNVGTATCQWTVTRDKPAVTITAPAQQPVKGDKATFTVTFGEAVHDFVQNDLTVLGGTVVSGSFKSVAATAPSVAYEVQVQATRPGTTVGLALAEHVCTNALGIGNAAAGPVTCEVDYTPPVIGALSVSPLRANPNITVTNSFDVTEEHLASVTISGVQPSAITTNSIGGGITHCTFETASTFTNFTIVATDTVGNETTTAVVSPLFVDNTAPTVTWSGLPAANSTNDASSVVAEIDTVSEDNVRVVWSLERGAESAVVVTNGEDWAVVGQTLLFNALDPGETYTFTWTSTDDVGNAKEESLTWTMAPLDPDAVVIVSGTPDGDSAVFTVTWQDSTHTFDASSFLLRVNNAATGEVAVASQGETSATVTVPLASYTAGAYIELTVPAGALGNRVDSNTARVSFTPAAAPVLTYIGRSFTNDAEVVWRLSNAGNADPTTLLSATALGVEDPLAVSARRDGDSWLVSATETWVPDVSAVDQGWNAIASSYKNVRLVYDDGNGNCITNIGLAEANVARAVYGGDVFIKKWNGTTPTTYSTNNLGEIVIPPVGQPESFVALGNIANGVFEGNRIKNWSTSTATFQTGKPQAAVITSKEMLFLRARNGGDINAASTWGNTIFHSILWQTTPSLVTSDPWEMQNVTIRVIGANGDVRGIDPASVSWSTNVTVSTSETIHRVDIPNVVGKVVNLVVNSSSKAVGSGADRYYIASIVEAAAMGTPVGTYEAPTPTATLDRTVTDDNRLHFHVDFDQLVDANSFDVAKLSASGLSGSAAFEISNPADRSCDITVSGLSDDGVLTLTLSEGFAKAPGGLSDSVPASFTFDIDATPPTLAFNEPTEEAGICRFPFTLSESVTGLGTNGMMLVTTGVVQAEIIGLERLGVDNFATVRASGWQGGDTLALCFNGVFRDLAGNTNAVNVTSAAITFADPTTDAVPSVMLDVGQTGGGRVSPAGEVAAVGNALANVKATPNAGYEFDRWGFAPTAPSVGVSATTNEEGIVTASFTGLADGSTITASFREIGSVTVTATAGDNGSASWTGNASVRKGGSTNVLFTAKQGYRIKTVKIGSANQAGTVGKTSYLVSLSNVTSATTVSATFEKIPDVTITVTAGGATSTTNILYNADWSRVFTAPTGKTIASLTVNSVAMSAAVGAASYTVQLFGVIEDTTVAVAYQTIQHTVTFTTERGTAPQSQTVDHSGFATNPGAPDYSGTDYTFVKWTLDGEAYDFTTPVMRDITLVAEWEEAESSEFAISGLMWTSFDPTTCKATFTATTEGDAPQTIAVVYRTTLDGNDQTEANCQLTLENGTGTVTLPSTLLEGNGLFLIGLDPDPAAGGEH